MGKLEIMMERKTKRMPNPAEAGFFIKSLRPWVVSQFEISEAEIFALVL